MPAAVEAYKQATGRRKTAVARVRIVPGDGVIVVNNRPPSEYFGRGAVCHGIARALIAADPELRPVLKAAGLLTRDSREKERKKYGLKRARKAPQYTKR